MAEAVRRLPGPARELLRLALVALAYFLAAKLSLNLALVHGQVTPMWPPTGIALVAFLVWGARMWPAIAIAAFAVNLPIGPSAIGAAVIGAGNTLAPMVAATLLHRVGFRLELDRLRDAASIVVVGALAGMTISATVGSLVLLLSGTVSSGGFAQTWAVWWTGDAMGVLLVAPLLLCFRPNPGTAPLSWARLVELGALVFGVGVLTFVLFQNQFRLEYLVFPLIMVAALRFRLRGSAPAALVASLVAVWTAVNGAGPFATENLLQKMVTLQVFNVFVALASLVLASYADTREREDQVSRMYLSAQLSSQAKSEFLKLAAHELRGPLTVLRGYLSLLSEGDLGKPPTRWRGPLAILSAKTWELSKIMDDLLEVSRLEADPAVDDRTQVDLRTVVEQAAGRARPQAALAAGRVIVELGSQPIPVVVDATQVGRIIENLIGNGLKYTTGSPNVDVATSAEGGQAVVRVTDDGVGIADGSAEVIFEAFRRGGDSAKLQVPGSGLGLYISRQLAESHGGTLVVEKSRPGHGSTFTLSLPLVAGFSPRKQPDPAPRDRRRRLGVSPHKPTPG